MNLLELISRAKSLYMIVTDPNSGWVTKLKALLDFAAFVHPFLTDLLTQQEGLSAVEAPEDAGAALAELEVACNAAPTEGLAANGEVLKKLLAFLKLILALV